MVGELRKLFHYMKKVVALNNRQFRDGEVRDCLEKHAPAQLITLIIQSLYNSNDFEEVLKIIEKQLRKNPIVSSSNVLVVEEKNDVKTHKSNRKI